MEQCSLPKIYFPCPDTGHNNIVSPNKKLWINSFIFKQFSKWNQAYYLSFQIAFLDVLSDDGLTVLKKAGCYKFYVSLFHILGVELKASVSAHY